MLAMAATARRHGEASASGQLQHVDPVSGERIARLVVLADRDQLLNGVGSVQHGVQLGQETGVVVEDRQSSRPKSDCRW